MLKISKNVIESSLFNLLDEVPSLLVTIKDENARQAEKVLKVNRLETCLVEFIHNFLLQFFRNGYHIEVDGLNLSSLRKIEKRLGSASRQNSMVRIFEKAICLSGNLEKAVYSSPPREDVLENAYLVFIPEVLSAFVEEGDGMEGFAQLVKRREVVLNSVRQIKETSSSDQ